MTMKPWNTLTIFGLSATLAVSSASALDHHGGDDDSDEKEKKAEIGEKAPNFTLTDVHGEEHSLKDFKGKTIILEWFNPECPFVVHLYEEGEFQTMPNELHEKDDYAWIAINSNSPGTQGHGVEKNRDYHEKWNMEFPLLIDEDNTVANMYDARTTPHMYIIDPDFNLVYHGAISNAPFDRVRGDGEKVNYVDRAIEQLRNGETVSPSYIQPWGCTVKYADGERRPEPRRDRDRERRRDRRR